jgi:ABC-type polysaccharide/polyol phosphate transport system ATPase subunit
MSTVIKAENLSKAYQLGEIGTGTLSRDLQRYWASIRGKEDPFLKIGEVNNHAVKGESDVIWSLKDLNFEIEQGDAVGIIGRNGAGKSTLLKILSRVTAPTTGSVKVKGRIASLLEVGTGFHPELSGRENIFLNGAILGMRKAEIKRQFDEIVDFSGVERYIDTPVKRYSSGMYVRLAFAVAAHLESEIMIVDEVLAVGDAEFQKKCLGKMGDVSGKEGRTVLFVSHHMGAVQKLCNRGILLEKGTINSIGKIEKIITGYLHNSEINDPVFSIKLPDDHETMLSYATSLQIEDANANIIKEIPVGSPWQIRVFFRINKKAEHFIIGIGISNISELNIRTTWSKNITLNEGFYEAVFKEENIVFAPGTYHITLGLSNYERPVHYIENAASFIISESTGKELDSSVIRTSNVGVLLNPMTIDISAAKDRFLI